MANAPDSAEDDARCEALGSLLRARRLSPEGRALIDRVLAEPGRYFGGHRPMTVAARAPQILRTLDALPGGVVQGYFDADGRGHLLWISPGILRSLGLDGASLGDLVSLGRRLNVSNLEHLYEQFTAGAVEQEDVRADTRLIDQSGRTRWMRLMATFDPPVDDRCPFVALVIDVTGAYQTSEALSRSDAAFRAILRGSRAAFALIDPDHRLSWFNDVAVRYAENMGWGMPQIGAPIFDVFDRDFYAHYVHAREAVLLGHKVERRMTFTTRRGTQPTLDVGFLPVRRPTGEIFAIGFTATDVTRQVDAEQAVAESDRILARLPVGVATVDRRGTIHRWRAAAPEMFDLPPSTAEGESLRDLLAREDRERLWPHVLESLEQGREFRGEFEVHRADGAQISIEITMSPIPEPEGHMVAVLEDVTARRALQRQVTESQKMEAVGLFAAGLAHDFNNLLAAVVGHTAMLDLDMAPDDPLRAEVEGIEQTTTRAATLVRSMLGLARQRAGTSRTIDLARLVRDAVPLLSRVAGSEFIVRADVAVELLPVRVDPVQIEQVLVNLVINARDASSVGGEIRIEVDRVLLGPVDARAMTMVPGFAARVDVVDQGTGMPPAVVSRVFQPFFTTKREGRGTGLGLSICSQILRASGGEIRIESDEGRGTRVSLWLPCSPDRPTDTVDAESLTMVGGDERILLVEDVADLRQVWSRLLGRLGYRVDCAVDGGDALALLDEGRRFDLLVSDVVMPQVGGLAVARRFRETNPDGPILMVSAYPGDAFDTTSLIDLRARLLRKPLTGPALARQIRRALTPA